MLIPWHDDIERRSVLLAGECGETPTQLVAAVDDADDDGQLHGVSVMGGDTLRREETAGHIRTMPSGDAFRRWEP